MKVALTQIPEGVSILIRDKRATLTFGDPPVRTTVATDGENILIYADRTYRHEELVRALGLKG